MLKVSLLPYPWALGVASCGDGGSCSCCGCCGLLLLFFLWLLVVCCGRLRLLWLGWPLVVTVAEVALFVEVAVVAVFRNKPFSIFGVR